LASQRVNEAIEAIQKPDMPFDMLNRWTRQAPLQAVAVAFLIGVLTTRRRWWRAGPSIGASFLTRGGIRLHQPDPLLANPIHETGSIGAFPLPASFFFKSLIFVVLTIFDGLDPMRRAADGPRVDQVRHSCELILTIFVRLLQPRLGRSVIVT
jgi:hypothetical protein